MPNLIKFLNSENPLVPTFLEAAQREMSHTTIDRYSNAFQMLKQDDIFDNLTGLATEYLSLFKLAKVEDEMTLSTQSSGRIQYFIDKLLTLSCHELLAPEGQLRPEIANAFQVDALCERIKKGELSQDYSEMIADIQRQFSVNEDAAIRMMVTDSFVKGYTAAIIMSISKAATQANALTSWRDENSDNKVTEGMVNKLINYSRTDPTIIHRNMAHLQELQRVVINPEIIKHTLADNSFYRMNLHSYIYTTIVGAVTEMQKLFNESTRDFPQSDNTQQYRTVMSNHLGKLLDEVTKSRENIDPAIISNIIKILREETGIFISSQQKKLPSFFKKDSTAKFSDVFTITKNVEILAQNFFKKPAAESKNFNPQR
ncbi:MAG: hypothetical protein P4M14_11860 [Gammaproteobacteria bacterium]|nr:hypothetical protein [Gammaproteobacteria bacterium]